MGPTAQTIGSCGMETLGGEAGFSHILSHNPLWGESAEDCTKPWFVTVDKGVRPAAAKLTPTPL